MKPIHGYLLLLCLPLLAAPALHSCSKESATSEGDALSANLPKYTLTEGNYYRIGSDERSVEIEFSEAMDTTTIASNLTFSDAGGNLDTVYRLLCLDRKVLLKFNSGFSLKPGWPYSITLKSGMRSVTGLSFPGGYTIRIRTTSPQPWASVAPQQRTAMLCISDIHMGEARAAANNYCWFVKNAAALTDLLDQARHSPLIREVVILGDLFDEWVVPYRFQAFDTAAGILNSHDYFVSVANSPVNQPVIEKLKAIAASDSMRLVYIPGNHDMLLTESILTEIIPGLIWKGSSNGMGEYSPVGSMVMEHGHRFDLFNSPQPLVNPGHMLPPGYFVSRLQAEGLMEQKRAAAFTTFAPAGSTEFTVAWTVALGYLLSEYDLTLHPDSVNIPMNGIDGYTAPMSYTQAHSMYAASIEDNWPSTQQQNGVPVNIPVAMGIFDGTEDLLLAANYEYLSTTTPKHFTSAIFGHTHHPEIVLYGAGTSHPGIYANTGSWVNEELCSHPVRTFLLVHPGDWSGSGLDVIALYQYNLNTQNPGMGYSAVLLAEESVETSK